MRVSPRGFAALRVWFIVAVVVGWNAAFLTGMYLNGGSGRIHDARALLLVGSACATVGVLALAILAVPSFRTLVTAPSRREMFDPEPYVLVALVTIILAVAAFAAGR